MVHKHFNASVYTLPNKPADGIETCSIRLFPTAVLQTALVFTGIYIPPNRTLDLSLEALGTLGAPVTDTTTQETLSHILAGDFNTTTWTPLFEEWGLEAGMWQLNDPTVSTANTGSTLDHMLFSPGFYIPSTFLPIEYDGEAAGDDTDARSYPAFVCEGAAFSDHYPMVLPIPCDIDHKVRETKRYKLGALTEEEWEQRDQLLVQKLERIAESLAIATRQKNVENFYNMVERALSETLADDKVTIKPRSAQHPMQQFLKKHETHPDAKDLGKAVAQKDTKTIEKLLDKIGVDGWRQFLATVKRSNTRAFYAYLANADGRKSWGFAPAESAPILQGDKVLLLNQEKCEALAVAFHDKLQAPAALDPNGHHPNPDDHPLEPFRERIQGVHEIVTRIEVTKAIRSLNLRRAPGPDGFPLEVYRSLPALLPITTRLINLVYATGRFPRVLRRIHLVPLMKPGKDPHQVSSRRPIALLNTVIKITEAVIHHRMLQVIEPRLNKVQYAYRRERGTEMCLAEIMDTANRALVRGRYVYLVSFDIRGAFDNVSHRQLTESLGRMEVDPHTRRVIHNWLIMRTFQVKMSSTKGTYYSNIHPITRGLPQGGVLSPLLWTVFFDPVVGKLATRRTESPDVQAECADFIYADDVTILISSATLEGLRAAAARNVEYLRQVLQELSLELNDTKTKNLILHPRLLPAGIYRRSPATTYPSTKARVEAQHREVAKLLRETLDYDPRTPPTTQECNFWDGFPFPVTPTIRILGVAIDMFFAMDDHYRDLVAKARLRQGILKKVTSTHWGLEIGVLKMTHDAIITSLLRYALVLTGSCFPPDLLKRTNTQII